MDMVNPSSPTLPVSRPNIHRQSSTSSSGSESQARPRKAVRSAKRRSSATQDDQSSRRGSASSMRNSTAPYEGPITYTPTTHRISKAKKGKRVHACEFAGCNKIFTRAEHKRRHELNHSPEASYPCDRAGCRKAFHRLDLLQRHQERHLLDAAPEGGVGHRRLPSDQSSTSVAHSMLTSTAMASPPMVSVQASNGLSIPSLLHPPSSEGYSQGHSSAYEFVPRAAYPMYSSSISASDDYIYSSPESSQSPLSDHYGFPHRNSISSSSSVVDFVPPHCTSPLLTSSAGWQPVLPPSALPSNCNPLDDDISFPSTRTGASIPVSISQLDGHEWHVLRGELVAAAGAVAGGHDRGLEIFHALRSRQDMHLAAYWDRFHPVLPVVHHPSFSATASALTTATMIAIGAQYDTHSENARSFSLAMIEACSRALAKRETIHSQSRLSDLQTVFLLEAFAKFRSRRPETSLSPRFRELFARLNHTSTRHWISRNPLALLNNLAASSSGKTPSTAAPSPSSDQAYTFWLNHETRRRLLLASFLLDRLTSTLFSDGGMVLFPPRPHALEAAAGARLGADLPFPCDEGLWECEREDWSDRAQRYTQRTVGAVAENLNVVGEDRSGIGLDSFQSLLVGCYRSHLPAPSPLLSPLLPANSSVADRTVLLTHHALRAAHHTPIHPLLIVAGESWLFGRKIADKAEYEAARGKVRAWLAGDGASIAVEHAVAVLWVGLGCRDEDENEEEGKEDEEDEEDEEKDEKDDEEEDEEEEEDINDDDEENDIGEKDDEAETDTNPPLVSAGLHLEWCIYFASLICWACTSSSSSSSSSSSTRTTMSTSPSPAPFSRSGSGSSLSLSISLSTSVSQSSSTSTSVSGTSTPAHAHTHTSAQPQPQLHGFPNLMDRSTAGAEMLAFLTEVRGRLAAAADWAGERPGEGNREGKMVALGKVEASSRGLLEFVRTRVLDAEAGGLVNDAVGVLFRLGEGRERSRGMGF